MKKNLFKRFSSKGLALSLSKGFTLIELLIVIAVLGVLATVVLIAINPLEQLARGRDAGRKNNVGQLASAIQSFYTAHQGVYPSDAAEAWIDPLVSAGELRAVPAAITYSVTGRQICDTTSADVALQRDYCYNTTGNDAVVYVALESNSEDSKCATPADVPYFVFSTNTGRSCLVCGATNFFINNPAAVTCNAVQ